MALTNLTADCLDDQEPQRVNNIKLVIKSGASSGTIPDDANIALALDTFPIPKLSGGTIEAGYLNEKRKFAGNPTFDDLTIVYKDLVTTHVAWELVQWRQLVHNNTASPFNGIPVGGIGYAYKNATHGPTIGYKRNGWVIKYGPSGYPIERWDVLGIWPSSLDPGEADMSGEDFIRINMTLTVDKVVYYGPNPEVGDPEVGTPADYQA
jgi:hypothetical protein